MPPGTLSLISVPEFEETPEREIASDASGSLPHHLAVRSVRPSPSLRLPPEAPRATLIPAASFLGSFRDLHEPFLNELRQPRHGIRVDLDSGKHVFVSPVVNLRRRATQLKLHAAFH